MSTPTRQVALTSEMTSNEISPSQLEQTAVDYQEQISDGLARAWHYHGTIQSFKDPNSLPHGWWYIKVVGQLDEPGAAGYHTDGNGQPYALVEYLPDWQTIGSHELVEMFGDPFGRDLYRAPAPDIGPDGKPLVAGARHRWVRVLKELADPVEADKFGYRGPEGTLLSDFVLHSWGNGRTGPYDVCGVLKHARQVEEDGYVSFEEADGTWMQLTNFSGEGPRLVNLGKASADPQHGGKKPDQSLREWIDAHELGATRKRLERRRAAA